MKDSANKAKVFFTCGIVLTFLVIALRIISLFTAYESEIGYYKPDALLPYIESWLIAASVLFFATVFIFVKPGTLPGSQPKSNLAVSFASLLCGFIFVCATVMFVLLFGKKLSVVNFFILLFSVVSTVYFVYNALVREEKYSKNIAYAGLGIIVLLILLFATDHLDYYVQLNAPYKKMALFSFTFTALFVAEELRFLVDKAQPRFYLFSALTAMLMCASTSVTGIVGHYAGKLSNPKYLIYYIITFGFSIYIATRLYSYQKYSAALSLLDESRPCEEPSSEAEEATAEEKTEE